MRLRPLGWKVYVKPDGGEDDVKVTEELAKINFEIRRGMDENEIRRSLASEDYGTVMVIGPLAWQRQDLQGKLSPENWKPWAKVGDRVVFGRHAGKLVREPDSGEWWMLINDEDVQSVIEPEDFDKLGENVLSDAAKHFNLEDLEPIKRT